jgi:hypothetical protein
MFPPEYIASGPVLNIKGIVSRDVVSTETIVVQFRPIQYKAYLSYTTVRNGHGNFDLNGKFTKNRLCNCVQSMEKEVS